MPGLRLPRMRQEDLGGMRSARARAPRPHDMGSRASCRRRPPRRAAPLAQACTSTPRCAASPWVLAVRAGAPAGPPPSPAPPRAERSRRAIGKGRAAACEAARSLTLLSPAAAGTCPGPVVLEEDVPWAAAADSGGVGAEAGAEAAVVASVATLEAALRKVRRSARGAGLAACPQSVPAAVTAPSRSNDLR